MNMHNHLQPTPISDYDTKVVKELAEIQLVSLDDSEEKAEKIYYLSG